MIARLHEYFGPWGVCDWSICSSAHNLLQEMSYLIGDARHGATCSRSLWRPNPTEPLQSPIKADYLQWTSFVTVQFQQTSYVTFQNLALHYSAVHTICIGNIWARMRKTHGDVKTKESKHPISFLRDWQFISSLTFNYTMAQFQKRNWKFNKWSIPLLMIDLLFDYFCHSQVI